MTVFLILVCIILAGLVAFLVTLAASRKQAIAALEEGIDEMAEASETIYLSYVELREHHSEVESNFTDLLQINKCLRNSLAEADNSLEDFEKAFNAEREMANERFDWLEAQKSVIAELRKTVNHHEMVCLPNFEDSRQDHLDKITWTRSHGSTPEDSGNPRPPG